MLILPLSVNVLPEFITKSVFMFTESIARMVILFVDAGAEGASM